MRPGAYLIIRQLLKKLDDLLGSQITNLNPPRAGRIYLFSFPWYSSRVLVVDDLFKKAATERNGETVLNESDNRIMFEIINHRYFNRLPLIISSEFTMNGLLNLEESLGSRIFEMTKGRFIEFKGREMNYRLTG